MICLMIQCFAIIHFFYCLDCIIPYILIVSYVNICVPDDMSDDTMFCYYTFFTICLDCIIPYILIVSYDNICVSDDMSNDTMFRYNIFLIYRLGC